MSGRPRDDELRAALEKALSRHFGSPVQIERLGRTVSDYSTSFTIEELDVRLGAAGRIELVFKDLGWGSLLAGARDVRPRFLYDPRREIAVYQHVLAGAAAGTARCYGAVVDASAERYWLFLERVPGPKLCHVGEFAAWEQAARWLASLHARFAGRVAGDGPLAGLPLLRYDREFYHLWLTRAREFVAGGGGAGVAASGSTLRWLGERYGRVIERLVALDHTLIHGEFYASNVLLRDEPAEDAGAGVERRRVCPLDWELAAVAPGLFDLAALTAGNWTELQRLALVGAYHEALTHEAPAGRTLALAEMTEALDYCRLHQAVQWLGWSESWSAPPDQAQDWLAHAVELAEKLRLW